MAARLLEDGTLQFLTPQDGQVTLQVPGALPAGMTTSLSVGPDGRWVGMRPMAGKDARAWSASTPTPVVLPGHGSFVNGMVFSPVAPLVLTTSRRRLLVHSLEDPARDPEEIDLGGMRADEILITPDGRRVIAADTLGETFAAWDLSDRKRVFSARVPGGLEAISLASSGSSLATLSREGEISLWNAEGAQIASTRIGESARHGGITFSPDEKTVYALAFKKVVAWEHKTGRTQSVAEVDVGTRLMAVSPDGAYLAVPKVGSNYDRGVLLFSTADLSVVQSYTGLADHANALRFDAASNALVFSLNTGAVYFARLAAPTTP